MMKAGITGTTPGGAGRHTELSDMPSGTNPDHDERYGGVGWTPALCRLIDACNHITNMANPHGVTAAQAGAIADLLGSVHDWHMDWGVGPDQVSADDIPDGVVSTIVTLIQETAWDAHLINFANPHAVTLFQLGVTALAAELNLLDLSVHGVVAGDVLQGTGPATAAWGPLPAAADYPMKQVPALVRWVIPGWYGGAIVNTLVTANRIYYAPIFVSETTTYIRIGVFVNAGAMAQADLRIFNWTNGLPGSLVLSAGAVAVLFAGWAQIVIAQALTRGYYYLALRVDGAPTLQSTDPGRSAPPVPGINTGAAMNPIGVVLFVDAPFADPAPAPTGILTAGHNMVALREN